MVIRKYIAMTEEEAAKLAEEELGKDVVIMNVKKNTPKGLAKLFKKPSVEITAAVDEIQSEEQTESFPDFSKLQEAIQETNAVLEAEAKKEEQAQKEVLLEKEPPGSNILADDTASSTAEAKEEASKRDIEERLSNLQDLLEKQMLADKKEKAEKDEKENTNLVYFDLIRKTDFGGYLRKP